MIKLFFLGIKTKIKEIHDFLYTLQKYRRNTLFIKSYLQLKCLYLLKNPYAISRKYLIQHDPANIYQYGETPIRTLNIIEQYIPQEYHRTHLYELGAGSGYTTLYFRLIRHYSVTSIEMISAFCQRIEYIIQKNKISNTTILNDDFLKIDFKQANIIYLYGSCMEITQIKKLIHIIKQQQQKILIISISFALSQYEKTGVFHKIHQHNITFFWGNTDVFIEEYNPTTTL